MVVLPDVIIVFETENDKFYASGEVKNPSGYPYKEGLTAHQAISMAGGLTEKAERGTFRVQRRVNRDEETVAVGLDSLVFSDDIIVVAEGHRRNQASWELRHWPSRDRLGAACAALRTEPRTREGLQQFV